MKPESDADAARRELAEHIAAGYNAMSDDITEAASGSVQIPMREEIEERIQGLIDKAAKFSLGAAKQSMEPRKQAKRLARLYLEAGETLKTQADFLRRFLSVAPEEVPAMRTVLSNDAEAVPGVRTVKFETEIVIGEHVKATLRPEAAGDLKEQKRREAALEIGRELLRQGMIETEVKSDLGGSDYRERLRLRVVNPNTHK